MITKHEYYVGGLSLVWEWDEETFAFTTIGGGRFVMKIKDRVIELASKMLVK